MTKYADQIFDKTKKWEFRKNLPKVDSREELIIVVYSSQEDQAIIGEFTAGKMLKCSFSELIQATGNENRPEIIKWLKKYYGTRKECCAIEVLNPMRYDKPTSLRLIRKNNPTFRPPQNFVYIKEDDLIDQIIK